MRWTGKKLVFGQCRIIKKFLWKPLEIQNSHWNGADYIAAPEVETRWLETVYIVQEYFKSNYLTEAYDDGGSWRNVAWTDEATYLKFLSDGYFSSERELIGGLEW